MNIALCAIAKCENLYINEWAEYHLNLGFDHIYVYDNNEIDGEKISDVLSGDRITVINCRGKHQSSCETQVKAYNECYNWYGRMYDWIMFIDIDEFLTLEKFGNIKDFLSQRCFADAKAVRFHWKCYSDSGKLKYEEGSVISRFTELCENGEVNKYYKQIYRTKLPKFRMMNVHYCDFIGGIYYPDGSSARYIMQTTDQNVNYVCGYIRHYVTKSLEEFVDIKWKRRGSGSSKTRLNKEFYFKYNKKTEEKSRYFDEYFNKVSNGVQPIGNGNTQHNTITQKQLKPKIMPYQQEPPIKSQTQSLGDMDYRTPQERAVCPGARKTANPAIKHGLPQKSVQNDLSVSEYPFGVSNPKYYDLFISMLNPAIPDCVIEDDMFFQYVIEKNNLKQCFAKTSFPFSFNAKNEICKLSDIYTKLPVKERKDVAYKTIQKIIDAKLIVNLTTWTKRDTCLYPMLKNLKQQTLRPDKIVLWLSEEEYDKNKLPKSIQSCIDEKLLTDVMWVKKNTKGHKRYDCFKYFNDAYNILLDDDILYKPNFLKELVSESKKHQNCITVYSSRSVEYVGVKVTEGTFIKEPSHKNQFIAGRCCFPPHLFPKDSYEFEDLRNEYVLNCDESWYRPFFIKHNIKINVMYQWDNSHYPIISDSQNSSLWNINRKILNNGMRDKERNFYNAIKITHTEELCKSLWRNMDIMNWTLKK